jgi:hypothetical protein
MVGELLKLAGSEAGAKIPIFPSAHDILRGQFHFFAGDEPLLSG